MLELSRTPRSERRLHGKNDELDAVAERAGSVNTLVVRDGRVHGSSTDGQAVTDAVDADGARVLVLGAG